MQDSPVANDAPVYATLPLAYRLAIICLDLLLLLALSLVPPSMAGEYVTQQIAVTYLCSAVGLIAIIAVARKESAPKRIRQTMLMWVSRFAMVMLIGLIQVLTSTPPMPWLFLVSVFVWTLLVFTPGRPIYRCYVSPSKLPQEDALRVFAAQFGITELEIYSAGEQNLSATGPAMYRYGPPAQFLFDLRLMDSLTPPEQLAVFAHELAHHRLRHSVLSRWARFADGLALLAAAAGWWVLVEARMGPPLVNSPLILTLTYLTAIAIHPLYLWYMRFQERQANLMALRMTDDPAAFESAMVKVAKVLQLPGGKAAWWTQWFFATHPTLQQTLAQARVYVPHGYT